MRKKLCFKISIVVFVLLVIFFISCIFLPRNLLSKDEVVFNIVKGEGSRDIALNLENDGFIWWGPVFRVYVYFQGTAENLKAGKYLISPSMTLPQIAGKFAGGDAIKERITIIEGWNLRDIGFYFENRGMFQAEELWELAGFPAVDYSESEDLFLLKDFSLEYDFLSGKSSRVGLEGYLFPDTYEIAEGLSLEEIVKKMLDNFGSKIVSLKEDINSQGKTIFEIITMASLIEKEVQKKEDKELVSGVLWKRFNIGMPLQVDATLSYITGEKTTEISKEETKINSPFNTYKYNGLPLGPICNPGLESILAALYPKSSEYWYYLSTKEGETIFSKTLEEHNVAKAKYLK